jgi:hypothetical protein
VDEGPAAAGWELTASADRDYFTKMDASGIEFPVFYPPRRFTLTGERAVIGRRSTSRALVPEIDLGAAPEDVGVSHTHAVLVRTGGTWSVVDPGSANGTYLNDSVEQLEVNVEHPLADGDRIHVGAWTTLTLQRTARA